MDLEMDFSAQRFRETAERDRETHLTHDFLAKWLFVDRLYARGQRKEMNFYEYEGPGHVLKYMRWIHHFDYRDWFDAKDDPLVATSVERDRACLEKLGLPQQDIGLDAIGIYNVQDYRLQRFYPVPDRLKPRTILDFGAGHGRMANLAFHPGEDVTDLMIAIEGIEGSYLTQRAYYTGLGLRFADYVDYRAEDREFDVAALADDHQLLHLPTWRFDLVPDASVDLICCVQVLKELPRPLTAHVIEQFGRVAKPGGAIYIRDHLQDHNPNHMPIDQLLAANGFVPEFLPQVHDRAEIHGVPRIWRKFDASLYLGTDS
ncbi:MAG: class I SAM-dependent methyltransferase [Parasphingopyxis sp.]|uniref:class I SAM-dependent methyltransferase n=1 Tax=Parasphingopyxis sp. TaxID=1920299 RepID=UPI003FA0D26F